MKEKCEAQVEKNCAKHHKKKKQKHTHTLSECKYRNEKIRTHTRGREYALAEPEKEIIKRNWANVLICNKR